MGDKRKLGPAESSLSKNPLKEYSTPPQARGLHPPGALVRTRWQVKIAPRQFYLNHLGAQGLLSRIDSMVPEEEELMTINIDSSEQSRARLQLQPTPCVKASPHPTLGFALRLAQPDIAGSSSPDPKAVDSVSPDGDPCRRQPLLVQAYGPESKL